MVAAPGANQPRGFLLDTNIVVAVFKQEEPVLAKLEDAAVGALFVPVITLGELRFGALKSVRVEENLRRIEGFAAESNILPCDGGYSTAIR